MNVAADEFAISRTFHASPQQVWHAFTQAEQLGQQTLARLADFLSGQSAAPQAPVDLSIATD